MTKGVILFNVTDAFPTDVAVTTMLLNVMSPTLHEKLGAVYVETAAVTQGAPHAGNPMNGIVITAAAIPKARLLICSLH